MDPDLVRQQEEAELEARLKRRAMASEAAAETGPAELSPPRPGGTAETALTAVDNVATAAIASEASPLPRFANNWRTRSWLSYTWAGTITGAIAGGVLILAAFVSGFASMKAEITLAWSSFAGAACGAVISLFRRKQVSADNASGAVSPQRS